MTNYPALPRVPDLTQPAAVCVAWIAAAEHEEMIDALSGFDDPAWYLWPAVGELTADSCPRPSHPVGKPETEHCTCRYGLYNIPDAPGPWIPVQRPGIRRPEFLTAAFRIDPRCEHHGEARRSGIHLIEGGGLYEYVLDEQERRGD